MSQHNITGSEAFSPSPHILVRIARRVRRPLRRATLSPAVQVLGGAAVVGLIASLLDVWIGAPVCLGICAAAFVLLWIWPSY